MSCLTCFSCFLIGTGQTKRCHLGNATRLRGKKEERSMDKHRRTQVNNNIGIFRKYHTTHAAPAYVKERTPDTSGKELPKSKSTSASYRDL